MATEGHASWAHVIGCEAKCESESDFARRRNENPGSPGWQRTGDGAVVSRGVGDASPGAGARVASAGSGATEDPKAAEDLQKRLEARFQRAQTKRQVRTSIAPPN